MSEQKPKFIPGLELSELLYREAVQPILMRRFPGLVISAALLGPGSDVLGFDTPQSTDHGWGPRLLLFLSEKDYPAYHQAIDQALRQDLPDTIHGYLIDMACYPDYVPTGNRENHQVKIYTVRQFFRQMVNLDIKQGITPVDWIFAPQQQLRSVNAGRVFHDGLGELVPAREKLTYYPHDVWLYLMAAQWQRISQEEPFLGRTAQAGDEIGSRIIAARLVRDLMNLGFFIERQYAPYIKWFGTAFARLDCAQALNPLFQQVLSASTWQERQLPLAEAYEYLAQLHNDLGLTKPLPTKVRNFYNRPFLVISGERFANALYAEIHDPEVLALPRFLGSVDQVIDSTDGINFVNQFSDRLKSDFQDLNV